MSRKTTRTDDAGKVLDKMIGDDPALRDMIAEETVNARVATMIYEARVEAGLTQKQLAGLVGTSQPVIARLEDADYRGHSLTMLRRIAEKLGKQLDISFSARGANRSARAPRRTDRRAAHVSALRAR